MSVQIRFLGIFKKFQPSDNGSGFWEVDGEGETIEEILHKTGLLQSNIGYTPIVNGIRKPKSYVLCAGDKVNIMPLVAGG